MAWRSPRTSPVRIERLARTPASPQPQQAPPHAHPRKLAVAAPRTPRLRGASLPTLALADLLNCQDAATAVALAAAPQPVACPSLALLFAWARKGSTAAAALGHRVASLETATVWGQREQHQLRATAVCPLMLFLPGACAEAAADGVALVKALRVRSESSDRFEALPMAGPAPVRVARLALLGAGSGEGSAPAWHVVVLPNAWTGAPVRDFMAEFARHNPVDAVLVARYDARVAALFGDQAAAMAPQPQPQARLASPVKARAAAGGLTRSPSPFVVDAREASPLPATAPTPPQLIGPQ